MKLFLAIEIPQSAKKKYARQLQQLHADYGNFHWIDPELYHVTLFFFGEQENPDTLISQIDQLVFDLGAAPFHMYAFSADLFMRGKLLMYANFHKCKPLQDMVYAMKPALKLYEDMDVFMPHMTIAHYKIPSKQQYLLIRKKLQQMEFDVDFPVTELVLYSSTTEGKKLVYTPIHRFPLHGDE